MELAKLQEHVATLKRRLVAAREQQPGGVAAVEAELCRESRPRGSAAGPAGASRHASRRFGATAASLAGSTAAAAAVHEEDPLVHSYDLLNMRQVDIAAATASRRRPLQQHQQEQLQEAPAQRPSSVRPVRSSAVAPTADGGGAEDEDELLVLDGSEEQMEAEAGGCYSEIESDVEEEQRQQQAVATAPALQQRRQQQHSLAAAGTVLGKRQADAAVLQVRPRMLAPGSSSALGSQAGTPDENYSSGGSHGAPLMAAAGPGRMALLHAPGKSFIRNAAAASVGIDRGKYISSGPDGKGGVATAYQGGPGGAPMRVSGSWSCGLLRAQASGRC